MNKGDQTNKEKTLNVKELIEAMCFNNLKLWEYAKVSGISPEA